MADQAFMYPDLVTNPDHPGRVSVTNGESEATFTGCASFTGRVFAGGTLVALPDSADPIIVGHIAQVTGEYESATLPLMAAYEGTTLSDVRFYIVFGQATATVAELNALLARYRSQMQQGAGLIYHKDDITDPTLVPPNSFRWNPDTEQVEQWRNGTWEPRNPSTLGPSVGRWDGNVPKHALAIVTGDVAIDFDDGPDYELTLSADAELQLPTNVEVGSTLDILVIGGGSSNTLTAATGITGLDDVSIRTDADARTRISMVVSEETAGTATAAQIIAVSFNETEVVEDNGYFWRSNVDGNTGEPQYDGSDEPISNANWTWVPSRKGDPGDTPVVIGTSTTSRTPGFGAQAFTTQTGLAFNTAQRLRAASDDGSKIIEGPCASYDPETGALTITCDFFKGSGAHGDWNISIAGEPGQSSAFSLVWNEGNTDTDPGSGQIAADNDDLSAATELYVDDLDRFGTPISAALLLPASVDNPIKADYTLQAEGGNARVDGTINIVADESGYVRFGIDNHSGATGFTAGTKVLLTIRPRANEGDDGANGLDGLDYGLPFTFRSKTAVEEPDNLGDFNLDNGTLASVTTLVISKFTASAGNPDTLGAIARWWAGGSTSDRARVTIKSRADESDFITGTISGDGTLHDDTNDWYEIPFTDVTGPGIPAGTLCSVEVTASGPEGVIVGGVDSFNGRSGTVTSASGDYDADQVDYDNATSGLTATDVQGAIDEVEDRVDDLETESFNKTSDDLDDITEGTTNKHFTGTEKTKLAGIEATADVTDAGNVGAAIYGSTNKATPVDADELPIVDSAASNVLKKLTWANLKAALATYFGFTIASSSSQTKLAFSEDTDNGSNKVTLAAPASIASDVEVILPGTAGTLPTLEGNNTFSGYNKIQALREKWNIVADNLASGDNNFSILTSALWRWTTAGDTNAGLNFRGDGSTTLNSLLADGDSVTVVAAIIHTGTAYYINSVKVDGTATNVTVKWVDGTAPSSGSVNAEDVYTFTILRTASATFTIFAQKVKWDN